MTCKNCNTELANAAGIGYFCPNLDCAYDVIKVTEFELIKRETSKVS